MPICYLPIGLTTLCIRKLLTIWII